MRPNPLGPGPEPPAARPPLRSLTADIVPQPEAAASRLIRPTEAVDPARRGRQAPLGLLDTVPVSPLADAIAKNDGRAVDQALARDYRRAIQPGRLGSPRGRAGLTEQDRRITTAVDTILANRGTLRVTDPANPQGAKIPLPQRPNLEQFADALDATKRDIFRLYDQMAQAGEASAVRVDLAPVIAKAREIENSVIARDLSPAAKSEAQRLASVMEAAGSYSPLEAQEMVEGINEISKSFWNRGAGTYDTTAIGVLNQLAHVLRDQLDSAVSTQGGPRYQALRLRYQALASVDQEVATALMKMANKPGGGLPYEFADLFSAQQLLHGVIDPSSFPRRATGAIATMTGKRLLQYLRDPNRAVGRMFEHRMQPAPRAQPYGAALAGQIFGAGTAGMPLPATQRSPAPTQTIPPPIPSGTGLRPNRPPPPIPSGIGRRPARGPAHEYIEPPPGLR